MHRFKHFCLLFVIVVLLAVFSPVLCRKGQFLVVIGGGERPRPAMEAFVARAGGEKAKILVITWASGVPDESFEAIKSELMSLRAGAAMQSPKAPLTSGSREQFVTMLNESTGVFFSGGDQNRIMDVLADERLLQLLKEKYASGTPFAGTSAGAAVMSDPMLTGDADLRLLDGEKVGIRKGLGLIEDVIFDQHFLVRQRHNRLFGLLIRFPDALGIGIDEDTAVLIEDNRRLTVVGKTFVMIALSKNKSRFFNVMFLCPGESVDLSKFRRKR